MRRRASAAVTGLRKRLSAASIEPPSVPVFFNLLPDAEVWPKTGRIGEQRLTLVQYWRQMQRGMAPDQGADRAPAADTTALPEPSVEQSGPTIYVNGQPVRPVDQTVSPVEPAAQGVTLLGPSTIATGAASGPHTAFKLEDFDDELDDARASSSETKKAADASTWAPASMVFARPHPASEPAEVDAPTPASHAMADETPTAAMDAATPVAPPMPMPSVLQAAGILLDPPPAADSAETPVAQLRAFGKEPEPVDAGFSGEAIQPSEAIEVGSIEPEEAALVEVAETAPVEVADTAPTDVVDVAAIDVIEVTTSEPAGVRALEPAEIVAFEPDLELGSLEGFIHEPARARASEVEIADLASDAFVVEGSEAAFGSFEPARQVDHAAGGFDAFAVDFLTDSPSDLAAVAGPMAEATAHDLASQRSVPDLQLEALTAAEPVSFEVVGDREPLDEVSFDASVLVGERAEPIFEVAADEPIAEPLVDAAPDEPVVETGAEDAIAEPAAAIAEAVVDVAPDEPVVETGAEDAIAEPAAAIAEAVVDLAAEEAALDPITESIVAEPVADHAEPLVGMAAPEPHDAAWEQPEPHAPVAQAEFVAPIAAEASSEEPHDEVGDAIEVSIPAASASTFVAPLTDDVQGAEAHDEEAAEMVDLPAASSASTFVAPLTADRAADHGDHHDDVVEPAHQLEMPVAADASTFAVPITADATADDHAGDAAPADLHLPAAMADSTFADVMHAGLDHAAASEVPGDGARAAADAGQMPVFEADGVWHDAMTEWATTTRDTRLRRAGVIPMPASKPLPVPVVSTRSAIPALERFMRSAQARRRRVSSESVA